MRFNSALQGLKGRKTYSFCCSVMQVFYVGCTRVPGWWRLVVNRRARELFRHPFRALYNNEWNIHVVFLNSGVRFDGHVTLWTCYELIKFLSRFH